MSGLLNWHDLEIFHAVLEHGSFSAAARALGMSQPTVSRHVEALERKLGRELFVRGAGGLEPSALACQMGRRTADMCEGLFGIQRLLDGEPDTPRGIVTLSLPFGFGGIVLARALADFPDHYPEVSIDLKFGPLQSNLGRREADIDVRWQAPTEPELIARPMGSFHFGLYATEDYLRRHGTPRSASDLGEHYFPHADGPIMEWVLAELAKAGGRPRHFPFYCSGQVLMTTILGAMGSTLTVIPVGIQPAGMQRVLPDVVVASPPLWLIMHSALRRNASIRAVWDWLLEHFPRVVRETREPAGDRGAQRRPEAAP